MRWDGWVPIAPDGMTNVYLDEKNRDIVSCHRSDEGVSENDKTAIDAEDADDHEQERNFDEPSIGSIYKSIRVEGLVIMCVRRRFANGTRCQRQQDLTFR